ncbi:hypothetical protein PF003_g34126 [Phytophthora fragariae]|nr:hypothetical protein PF003_g34126 [Phytophthora fragariae]
MTTSLRGLLRLPVDGEATLRGLLRAHWGLLQLPVQGEAALWGLLRPFFHGEAALWGLM